MRNGRALNQLALQFVPESPDTLGSGRSTFGIQLDIFNNLLVPTPRGATILEDFEEQRVTLSWRKGVGRGIETGLFLPIRYRNAGVMDEVLRAWHRILGVPGRNRDNPLGREGLGDFHSVLRLWDRTGAERVRSGNAVGPGDLTATVKRGLIRANPRSGLATRLAVKLPTGNPGQVLGSGTFGAGLSVDGRYSLGRWFTAYGNAGRVWSGGATRVPGARKWVNEYLLAMEYRPNRRDSYLLQLDGNSVVVATGNQRADESQATFTVGYRRDIDSRTVLYGSFSENGDWNNNTTSFFGGVGPDVSFTMGVILRR